MQFMRKIDIPVLVFVIILIFGIPINSIGQETDWYSFELEKIEIEFPTEEVYQFDTIVNGFLLKQLYTHIENSTFILQKLPAEKSVINRNLSSLPYNYSSLIEYYDGVIEGTSKTANAQKVTKEEIRKGDIIGYKSLIYKENDEPFIESRTFLAGKNLIMASIYNPDKEMREINTVFFNSLNLDGLDSLDQYTGVSKEYKQGYIFAKLVIYAMCGVGIFFLIRIIHRKK